MLPHAFARQEDPTLRSGGRIVLTSFTKPVSSNRLGSQGDHSEIRDGQPLDRTPTRTPEARMGTGGLSFNV